MNDTTPITYEQRRQHFIAAVNLLGGQAKAAARLDIAERTMRDLVSGRRHIHDGFMADITTALYDRERMCRELARKTDPLFIANRVSPPPRGGASHRREKTNG
jgi:DNA-binding transcriptional regulator YdaS (Cro superfamily)